MPNELGSIWTYFNWHNDKYSAGFIHWEDTPRNYLWNLQINRNWYERNLCHILTVKPKNPYFQDKNSSNEVDVAEVTCAVAGQWRRCSGQSHVFCSYV